MRRIILGGIILGNLPFVGISYKGHHHERALVQEFSHPDAVKDIHQKALQVGIQEFAIQIPENEQMKIHWEVLSEISDISSEVSVIPNISIPLSLDGQPLDVYRRWATVLAAYNSEEILEIVANDKILQCRPDWQTLIVRAVNEKRNFSIEEISRVKLDRKTIELIISQLAGFPVQFLEFGSEVDFLVASRRIDLVGELIDLGKSYGYSVGFGVHHAALTLPKLEQIEGIKGFLTPINPIGLMMFPTQGEALQAAQQVENYRTRLIGIKPLAGGHYLRVKQSLAFLAQHGIERFMIGISSASELKQAVNEWNRLKET